MKRGFMLGMVVVGLLAAHGAAAHVLATDGTIGAVMHTDPDDEAIAGEPAAFFLEFKDTTRKFKPQDCTCTMSLEKDGQAFFTQAVFAQTLDTTGTTAAMSYTFAEPDTYQLVVTGVPKVADEFAPFTLRYDVEVVSAVPQAVTAQGWVVTHLIHVIGAIILAIVTIGMIIYERVRPAAGIVKV